jgi:Uma2 family endonuclease
VGRCRSRGWQDKEFDVSVADQPKVPIYKLSVDKYEQMIRAGILTEDDQVELLHGVIRHKMPPGPHHIAVVNRLTRLLIQGLAGRAIVSVQNPIVLSDSEPEPDLTVLLSRTDDYATAKPRSGDVLLLIEVADSSLTVDRLTKMPLYAQAGIAECWIVNLLDRQIEVFRQPTAGEYVRITTLHRNETAEPLAFPDIHLAVNEILG